MAPNFAKKPVMGLFLRSRLIKVRLLLINSVSPCQPKQCSFEFRFRYLLICCNFMLVLLSDRPHLYIVMQKLQDFLKRWSAIL